MEKPIKEQLGLVREQRVSLGMLIHDRIRVAFEQAAEEELALALGAAPCQRSDERRGHRSGKRQRMLTAPTAPVAALTLPRATLFGLRGALERKAPKHALDEIKADYHLIVYGENGNGARGAYHAFVRKWKASCPGVVRSLQEGGDELLTFCRYPNSQWMNGEFRRRTKTQGSLPTEDAALVLLFGLIASGQIKLRKIDGWRAVPRVLGMASSAQPMRSAA